MDFDLDADYQPIEKGLIYPRMLSLDAARATLGHFFPGPNGKPPVRIAILAGAGVEHSGCEAALRAFAEH